MLLTSVFSYCIIQIQRGITSLTKVKKKIAYTKDVPGKFYDFCCKGYSPARIAFMLGTTRKQLLSWYNDPQKYDFIAAWDRGKEAYQAYHEKLLDEMITGERSATAPAIAAQQYRLRTQFKEDWSDKQETKLTVTDEAPKYTPEQLASQILAKLQNKYLLTDLEEQLKKQLLEKTKEDKPTIN